MGRIIAPTLTRNRLLPFVMFAIATAGTFTFLTETRRRLPPIVLSFSHSGNGPVDVEYDTGFGFNPDQAFRIETGPYDHALLVHDLYRVRIQGSSDLGGGTLTVAVPGRAAAWYPLDHGRAAVVEGIDTAPLRVRFDRVRTPIQAVIALLTGWIAAYGVRRGLSPIRYLAANRDAVGWFLFYGVVMGFWTVALWPGILVSDSVSPAIGVCLGRPNTWFSAAYVVGLETLAQIGPVYRLLTLCQAVVVAGIATTATVRADRAGVPRWLLGLTALAFVAASPVLGSYASLAQRGVFAALMSIAAVLGLQRGLTFGLTRIGWTITGSLFLTSALLKTENIALVGAAAITVFVLRPVSRRSIIGGLVVLAGVYVIATGPGERWVVGYDTHVERSRYQLTGLLNPAGAVLARGGALTAEENAAFGRILPPDVLAREWSPYHDGVYWAQCDGKDYDPADVARFRTAVFRSAARNLPAVLEARWETYRGTVNGPRYAVTLPLQAEYYNAWVRTNAKDAGVWHEPPVPSPGHPVGDFLRATLDPDATASAVWFVWPQLAVLLTALVAARTGPATAAAAAVLLARQLGVFAAAPGSYFHYVFDVYLFGLFVPAFWFTERRARRAKEEKGSG